MRKSIISLSIFLALAVGLLLIATRFNINPQHSVGEIIDTYNGIPVYYNGAINHVSERNVAPDGYNIGLKHQCVEFVKRYYYERFQHKMPQDRGHARDFFNANLPNGALNVERGLIQYTNGAGEAPIKDDLIIFSPWALNRFGHVAIVSNVGADYVEIVQQNAGPFGTSREKYPLITKDGKPYVDNARLQGWLRKQAQ